MLFYETGMEWSNLRECHLYLTGKYYITPTKYYLPVEWIIILYRSFTVQLHDESPYLVSLSCVGWLTRPSIASTFCAASASGSPHDLYHVWRQSWQPSWPTAIFTKGVNRRLTSPWLLSGTWSILSEPPHPSLVLFNFLFEWRRPALFSSSLWVAFVLHTLCIASMIALHYSIL